MSDRTEVTLSRVLPELRSALHGIGPSSTLDARFRRTVDAWSVRRRSGVAYRRALPSLIAASIVAAVVGFGWWLGRENGRSVPPAADIHGSPTPDAAVLHVQATLGARAPGQGQYWVDIGVTGDGTLRVERVTPVDERFVP